MKPYYQDEQAGISIYCGDARVIVPTLSGIDAVIADPPYGMGWQNNQRFSGGNTRRGAGTRHEMIVGDHEPFDPSFLLDVCDRCVLWGANHFWDKLPPAAALIWIKRNDSALGTFLSDAEVAYLSVGVGVYGYTNTFAGATRAIEAGRDAYAGSAHPNQKPVGLMAWCIERAKVPAGGLILDSHCGSGSTLVAAKQGGFRAIGIDIDESHCRTAAKRLAQGVLPFAAPHTPGATP